jgi:hypothetical protein
LRQKRRFRERLYFIGPGLILQENQISRRLSF